MRALLVQPKRLALFAYLALANPPRLHRRDSLFALFWPESSDEQARRSLRQALHFLRTTLGPHALVSRGDDEIGVDFGAVWCDVREFERALHEGRGDEALRLYRGHLLEGFHVSGVAPELGHWLDDERSRLRERAVIAARAMAEQAECDGNAPLAIQLLREVLRLDAGTEAALRRLMLLLDRAGDRTGALRAYDEFARRLAAEAEAPSPESRALAERIHSGRHTAAGESTSGDRPSTTRTSGPGAAEPRVPGSEPRRAPSAESRAAMVEPAPSRSLDGLPAKQRSRFRRSRALVTGLVAAALAGAAALHLAAESDERHPRTLSLAVGAVEDHTGGDSLGSVPVLRDLLATDLARVPGVTVVSQTRLQELLARLGAGDESRAALTRAAQSAGAEDVLEGEVYRRPDGLLRLDVRRVDAASGVIRRAYSSEGADLFALVGRLSEQVAAELGQKAPSPALADLTTTSLVARRFYEEGVRAYYQGDPRGALRLFQAALAEDSTFPMAAYFASRVDALPFRFAAQAVRMSRRATEREQLLVATHWAEVTNHPSLVPLADSLARRFPLDPEAEFALGRALSHAGDFRRAILYLRRAADRDSLSLADSGTFAPGRQPPCTACEAFNHLVTIYTAIDSIGAAERAARDWIRRQPRSLVARHGLARMLAHQGRFAEALEALRTRHTVAPGETPDDAVLRAMVAIQAGAFAEADRLLAERAAGGGESGRKESLWWQVISLRNQGRLGAALAAAVRWRAATGDSDAYAPVLEAQVLFEMGRARDAARLFEGIAANYRLPVPVEAPDPVLGRPAQHRGWYLTRHRVWYLTHAASAYAAAGDTGRVARLADSLQALGARSAYGRDRRLHHHLRGLLLVARGRQEEAAAAFGRAIHSPTLGFTRTNLELGRVLLALGRPREAAAILAPALRGDLQASNLYVTHAELHEALAEAYEAAGEPDSARAHFAWVANAWRAADAPFRARAMRAREKSR